MKEDAGEVDSIREYYFRVMAKEALLTENQSDFRKLRASQTF